MRVEPNEIMDESYMQLLLRKAEGENCFAFLLYLLVF